MAASIFLITAGVVFCLFGYAVYRLWMASAGLLTGLGVGLLLGRAADTAIWPILACVILGAALAGVFYYFQTAGTILTGAEMGFFLAMLILYTASSTNWLLTLTGAVIGGVCSVFFSQSFIIAGTAAGGASGIILGLYSLFAQTDLFMLEATAPPVTGVKAGMLLAAIMVMTAIGGSVQSLLLRRRQRVSRRYLSR